MEIVSEEHNLIAIGCANGVVDFIKVDYSNDKCSLTQIAGIKSFTFFIFSG